MNCAECRMAFSTWRVFKRHMVNVHQVAEANLVRRASQLADCVDIVAVRSGNGNWFLFGQGSLL